MPGIKFFIFMAFLFVLGSYVLAADAFAGPVAGQPWVFGSNSYGKLGLGGASDPGREGNPCPENPIGLDKVVKASLDWDSSVVLLSDGTVWVCGDIPTGYWTSYDTAVFVPVAGLDNVIDLAGYVAVKSDGTVWRWCDSNGFITDPFKVEGIDNVIAISGGLALKSDGTVWYLFWNPEDGFLQSPTQIKGLNKIVAISEGFDAHYMALDKYGRVWTWGSNDYGQLGYGLRSRNGKKPAMIRWLGGVKAIAAGDSYSMALLKNGSVLFWGTLEGSRIFVLPHLLGIHGRAVAISAGYQNGHIVMKDGSLWSIGYNYGDFGNCKFGPKWTYTPVKSTELENVVAVFGDYFSGFAITAEPTNTAAEY